MPDNPRRPPRKRAGAYAAAAAPRRRRPSPGEPASAPAQRRRRGSPAPDGAVSTRRRRADREGAPRNRHRFRRIAVRLIVVGLLVGIVGLVGLLWYASTVPLPPTAVPQGTSVILAADGKTQIASFDSGQDRTVVTLGDVSPALENAVLAAEDRYFYSHGGLDPVGIARALLSDLRTQRAGQGGSTITQQYVKNVYVGRDRTAKRKVREAILAVKLEQKLSKDEILERYLNTIYMGRGSYGVQAASKAWFNKDAKDLGPQEATYLAGIIRSPEGGNVDKNEELATRRRDSVAAAMVRIGSLPQAEADVVKATPIQTYVIRRNDRPPTVARSEIGMEYVVDYVRRSLADQLGEKVVLAGGLEVTTSIDIGRQEEAYDAVYGPRPALQPGEPDGALVSIDEAGHIVALVGGRDHTKSQVNLALGTAGGGGGRLAGSTFKPFLLAEVVKQGFSLDSAFPAPSEITLKGFDGGRDYKVSNFEDESFPGQINLVDATVHSVNTVYGQVAQVIGPDKIIAQASALGVKAKLEPNASAVLGTDEVSPLDMASAYSTLARGGTTKKPTIVIRVRNSEAETLLDASKVDSEQVLSADEAATVTYAMRQVVERGTGVGAKLGRPAAGKTGTTTNNTDAWFVGYSASPRLTTAVWMGYSEGNRPMDRVRGRPVNGGGLPASIWRAYMDKATAGAPPGDFPPLPDQSKKKTLPKASGRQSTKGSTTLPPGGPSSTTGGVTSTTPTTGTGATTTSPRSTTSTSKPAATTTTKPPAATTTTAKPPPTTAAAP